MDSHDVVILGGGLAGLTLALQLKRARPGTSVLVAERREGAAPEAAFKVGESSQPLSGHYFAEVVGMRDHIEADQLPKCGLRFLFPADGNRDIARRTELGPPGFPPPGALPSYQLDRGRFENELMARAAAAGVEVLGGATVGEVALSDAGHEVEISRNGRTETARGRWVVDAAGRAALLKRRLGLATDVPHRINSSWLRLRGGVDLEDWSDDEAWLGRMGRRGDRRFSTTHLMGEGYWVWLIPLASGATSIGIVADPRFHPFEAIDTLDGALDWFARHEPQLGEALAARREDVQDFLTIENFSLGVERVFSPDRWALTGDAGAFLDPLISPGSDFIAVSNSLIADSILRDLDGEEVGERVEALNGFYLKLFETWLEGYVDSYQALGNEMVFTAKRTFDNIPGFALAFVFAQGRIVDAALEPEIAVPLDRLFALSRRVQGLFRAWHVLEPRGREGAFVFPPLAVGAFRELMGRAGAPAGKEGTADLLGTFLEIAEASAVVLYHRAADRLPGGGVGRDARVDPHAVSLDPARWEADGLVSGAGLTYAEALARVEGLDRLLDYVALR